MKTASDWIFVVSKYTYSLWNGVCVDQGRNLCNTFPLIAQCCIACQKKWLFKVYSQRGYIYHQMRNCIKSRILNVYGLLPDCLFFFARQKLTKILQFPIFGSGRMKLVSFDRNFIDWHICKSQTHLSLLKDKEKLLLILLGKNGSSSNDQLCSSWVFKEFFNFFLTKTTYY